MPSRLHPISRRELLALAEGVPRGTATPAEVESVRLMNAAADSGRVFYTANEFWDAFSALPIEDRRTDEQRARWEAAIEEIRAGHHRGCRR